MLRQRFLGRDRRRWSFIVIATVIVTVIATLTALVTIAIMTIVVAPL